MFKCCVPLLSVEHSEIKNCDTNPGDLLSKNERKSSISGIPPPPSSAPPKLPDSTIGESSEKSSTNIALESSEKSSTNVALDSSTKDSASSVLLESTEIKPKKKKIGMKKNRKKKVENTAKVDINKDIHSKIQGLDWSTPALDFMCFILSNFSYLTLQNVH